MNPALFRKLVELRAIAIGSKLEVKYELQNDNDQFIKYKGEFAIVKMYTHPFAFNTIIQLSNQDDLTIEVDFSNILKIDGIDPVTLGAQHKLRPDGCSEEAPKRRGRKPKVRPEVEEVYGEFTDDELRYITNREIDVDDNVVDFEEEEEDPDDELRIVDLGETEEYA